MCLCGICWWGDGTWRTSTDDNGYYSEKNLAELLHAHFDFITLIKTSIKWVRKELDAHLDGFRSTGSACPFDIDTHCVTIMRM